jgi:hypothetical protein
MVLGLKRYLLTPLALSLVTWLTLAAVVDDATAAAPVFLTHPQAAAHLQAADVTWTSSGDCSDRTDPRCTSFSGIRKTTVDGIRTLRSASGCPIVVTGGTEAGHAAGTYSHWNGWKIDIRRTACVDAYVTRWFTYVGTVEGWGRQWRARSGNLYTNEGRHWDIIYYTCGCRS